MKHEKTEEEMGKHVGSTAYGDFLVISSQAALYIDGTTPECWGISIVFPLTFFCVSPSEISESIKMAEAMDVGWMYWIYVPVSCIAGRSCGLWKVIKLDG